MFACGPALFASAAGPHVCTNGPTWAAGAFPVSADWLAVAGGLSTFIALRNGTDLAYRSTDFGATWTGVSAPPNFVTRDKIAFQTDRFVIVEQFVATWRSLDLGVTWLANTGNAFNALVIIPVAPTGFVILGNSSTGHYSTDGDTFSTCSMPGADPGWTAGASGNGVTVALTNTTTARSLDGGVTWTATGAPPAAPLTSNHSCAYIGPGIFACSQANPDTRLMVTTDAGLTWHFSNPNALINIQRSLVTANGICLLSTGVTTNFTSTDGDNWATSPNAGTTAPFDMAETAGHYVGTVGSTTTLLELGTC